MKKIKSSKFGSIVGSIVELMVLLSVKDLMITSSALTLPLFPPFTATVTVSPKIIESLVGWKTLPVI